MVAIDLLQQAKQYFDLQPPFSLSDLKKAFRAAAKKTHSDLTQKKTDGEFIKVKECYDALMNIAETDGSTTEASIAFAMTTDGMPLSQLGLGLGPMKNGRDCPRCDHRGYTEDRGIEWRSDFHRSTRTLYRRCYECKGTGEIEILNPVIPKGRLFMRS